MGMSLPSKVFLEVMNSVLMTGEIPGLFAKDEMMAMTADLRNSFLKVGHENAPACAFCASLKDPPSTPDNDKEARRTGTQSTLSHRKRLMSFAYNSAVGGIYCASPGDSW